MMPANSSTRWSPMSDMFRNHANVFVHADAPQYAALDEWRRSGRADPRDWHDDDRGRAGIWVALSIVQRLAAGNFGDCKPLSGGVWELRIDHGPGYRLYYARAGERLKSFIKMVKENNGA